MKFTKYIKNFVESSDIDIKQNVYFISHGGENKMAVESVKSQMQFHDIQKANRKPVEIPSTIVNNSEVVATTVATQGNGTGVTDNGASEEDQNQASPEARVKSAVKLANSQMKHAKTRCEFSYHEQTNRVSIKVIDKDTQEVIREIPPEETLEMVEKMWELAGILVDERR
jgi:flagellar protein FlaG